MSGNFRKNKKENEYFKWLSLFELEFTKFHGRVKTELEKTDLKYKYDGSELEKLNESFQSLKRILMLTTDKGEIDQKQLTVEAGRFLYHLNGVDKLVKEKVFDTSLKRAIEHIKCFIYEIFNFLYGTGPLVIVAEAGVYLVSTDPNEYTLPKKPLSQSSEIPRSLLFKVNKAYEEPSRKLRNGKVYDDTEPHERFSPIAAVYP